MKQMLSGGKKKKKSQKLETVLYSLKNNNFFEHTIMIQEYNSKIALSYM